MYSPEARTSPSYRNIKLKNKQSPIEIKEQLRKNYREKVSKSRHLLFSNFRGSLLENEVRNTLNQVVKDTYSNKEIFNTEEEENIILEIQEELVKEELNWCLEEYEKSQGLNIDLNIEEENVICPVCQKVNLNNCYNQISCPVCHYYVKTEKMMLEIKNLLINAIEKHSQICNHDVQFTAISEPLTSHIYMLCGGCNDMQLVL